MKNSQQNTKVTYILRDKATGSDHIRTYHSRRELFGELEREGGVLAVHAMRGAETPNTFLNAILDIPGVCSVKWKPYSATLEKAPTYQWPEIERPLLALLAGHNMPIESTLQEIEQCQE